MSNTIKATFEIAFILAFGAVILYSFIHGATA